MTTMTTTSLDERLVQAAIGALELFSIHLGRELGLYRALTEKSTVHQLATRAEVAPRYAREWLEQQAVAGLVDVDDESAAWNERAYSLSVDQHALLVESDDPSHVSPLADMIAGVGGVLDQVAEAYRTGAGVPYRNYGPRFRSGQGEINRPAFVHDLADTWLTDAGDVTDRLRSEGGRIADIGCGTGWSTVALAQAFPKAEVVGFDLDDASIADAVSLASDEGVEARFHAADGAVVADHGPFDLVFIAETLHDLADPDAVLAAVRSALAPNGVLVIADEKVAPRFTTPGDELERMMYGWSVVHCLPASLAEPDSAAIGTVIRPGHVRLLARQNGFGSCSISEVDGGFFNIYVARP